MEDLFYSTSEKKLFWIAGYTDNSYNVKEIVSTLTNNRNHFIKTCKLPEKSLVRTDYITKSSRYKSMRYFWVDNIKTPPKNAFELGDDWTMDKWISN
ncbi:MAG: hypothetical protein IPJ01_10065 [Micavibrio sp.]|nr:hypothetical protein [Micavibrio sp.]